MTDYRHDCPGVEPAQSLALTELLQHNAWFMGALGIVARSGLPDAWIGAGAVRDVVWSGRRFDPREVRDLDVAFFDPADLGSDRDAAAQQTLRELADLPWEATNQAAVHTWYREYFGGPPVDPFASVHDAVATWPETATCVAVRLRTAGLEVCSPHGLSDLLTGVWRANPVRVTPDISLARLARQRVHARWPRVTVVPPAPT
ncbi:MAG TPA: nucleotidyltransferase family protein [Streptosporangiaceae bacterium]|nr:nucleotidyltransferase family protein [Streptosporangiaceae bacterium]